MRHLYWIKFDYFWSLRQLSWWFYTLTLVLRMLIQKGINLCVLWVHEEKKNGYFFSFQPTILLGILFYFFPPENFSLYIDVIIYNELWEFLDYIILKRHSDYIIWTNDIFKKEKKKRAHEKRVGWKKK